MIPMPYKHGVSININADSEKSQSLQTMDKVKQFLFPPLMSDVQLKLWAVYALNDMFDSLQATSSYIKF